MKNMKNQSIAVEKGKNSVSPFMIVSFAVLLLYALSLILPMVWALMTSFKANTLDYLDGNKVGWPREFVNNYGKIIEGFFVPVLLPDGRNGVADFVFMAGNSIWYALGTSLVSTTVAMLVGYVVARYKFKFCDVIYTVIILQMIVPTVGTLPSELRIANALHLYDTPYGILFMKSYVAGLYFLSFYAALRVIPKDYAEAAYLDGAGNFSVMVRIMLPMVGGVFSTIFLLNFITYWNDYQTPLIYMPSYPTLAYGLWYYINRGAGGDNVPMRVGGCMMMAVPLFILFIAFQKKLLSNVSLGGLK